LSHGGRADQPNDDKKTNASFPIPPVVPKTRGVRY